MDEKQEFLAKQAAQRDAMIIKMVRDSNRLSEGSRLLRAASRSVIAQARAIHQQNRETENRLR